MNARALGPLLAAALLTAPYFAPPQPAGAATSGKDLFENSCAMCHQSNGQGVPGSFPPLAKNPDVVASDPTKIIGIVLHGLDTPITVNGAKYENTMPSWKGQLTNAEIAAVLTYVRSSWGNKAAAVTEKDVAAVK